MSHHHSRRNFLLGCGALSVANVLPGLGLIRSHAQAAGDYKALVCVFLYGGNDADNTVVPVQNAEYASYQQGRGAVAIPQAQLVQLPQGGQVRFGLHPALQPLQAIWNGGRLALMLNVGPLLQPLTRAQYQSMSNLRPMNLFSHDDQQTQWQTAVYRAEARVGWGGLTADAVQSLNGGGLPAALNVTGNDVFLVGSTGAPMSVPSSGNFGLQGYNPANQADAAKYTAMQNLWTMGEASASKLTKSAAGQFRLGIAGSQALAAAATAQNTLSDQAFGNLNTGLANQLRRVAKIIEARGQTGARRQIFMASLGGFDNHSNLLSEHASRLGQVGPALAAFDAAMTAIGASNMVTTFTMSDFSRTFRSNNSAGSDHGWGAHHLIMGGAVRGTQTYGIFPTLAAGGPDDSGSNGRWIPTTSVDQFGATLAAWFGVPAASLPTIFPNLSRFQTQNLGFMV